MFDDSFFFWVFVFASIFIMGCSVIESHQKLCVSQLNFYIDQHTEKVLSLKEQLYAIEGDFVEEERILAKIKLLYDQFDLLLPNL